MYKCAMYRYITNIKYLRNLLVISKLKFFDVGNPTHFLFSVEMGFYGHPNVSVGHKFASEKYNSIYNSIFPPKTKNKSIVPNAQMSNERNSDRLGTSV